MTGKRVTRLAPRLVAPIIFAMCLNGCIAAAIPAIAGAAVVRSETNDKPAGSAPEHQVEVEPAPVAELATPVASAPLPENMIAGPAPAPKQDNPASIAAAGPYLRLVDYARSKATAPLSNDTPPVSAVLSNPTRLDGERKPCRASRPVVLIDIDPHGGAIDPQSAPAASASLVGGLQSLRDEGIDIAWLSQSSAARAGDIRAALTRTGLDPQAKDRLVLMRYRGDRKQTRREEIAKESCLIAIAGDHREDFDELFEYLVNPETALGLDLLIGDGWFLVPPVLGEAQ